MGNEAKLFVLDGRGNDWLEGRYNPRSGDVRL